MSVTSSFQKTVLRWNALARPSDWLSIRFTRGVPGVARSTQPRSANATSGVAPPMSWSLPWTAENA